MGRRARVATAVRFEPEVHEALVETADELGVAVNWIVNQLCKEGLARIDLTSVRVTRPG